MAPITQIYHLAQLAICNCDTGPRGVCSIISSMRFVLFTCLQRSEFFLCCKLDSGDRYCFCMQISLMFVALDTDIPKLVLICCKINVKHEIFMTLNFNSHSLGSNFQEFEILNPSSQPRGNDLIIQLESIIHEFYPLSEYSEN